MASADADGGLAGAAITLIHRDRTPALTQAAQAAFSQACLPAPQIHTVTPAPAPTAKPGAARKQC